MSKEHIADVCVLGSGVVGCAVALCLSEAGHSVLVIDRAVRQATGTTARNSEVIHAGLYYPHGSLKAKLCVEGRHLIYERAQRLDLHVKKIGKLIVAHSLDDVAQLEALAKHAAGNGVENLRLLNKTEIAKLEPHVAAQVALYCPESGILSAHELCDSYLAEAESLGCRFVFRTALEEVRFDGKDWQLTTASVDEPRDRFEFKVKAVVNCCGLYADEVAAKAGIDLQAAGYQQHWVKGNYFALSSQWSKRLRHLIYPLPEKNLRGLGVHVTIDLGGQVKLGPDVEELPRVEDYAVNSAKADAFYESAKRYLPELELSDLSPAMAGIRPKLSRAGEAQRDFVIAEESAHGLPGLVNLLGIESPGLTSSLAIGRYVTRLLS